MRNGFFVAVTVLAAFFVHQPSIAFLTKFTFVFIFSFLSGILLYQYKTKIISKCYEFVLLLGILAITKFLFLIWIGTSLPIGKITVEMFLAGLLIASVGIVIPIGILKIKKVNKGLIFLGKISYSLYLTHFFISAFLVDSLTARGMSGNNIARILSSLFILIVCISFAYIFYLLIEKPSQAWASKIKYRSSEKPL